MRTRKILVPVDFSRESRAALYDALSLAHRADPKARVDVLHVLETPALRAGARRLATRFLSEFSSQGIEVRARLPVGPVAETIAAEASESGYDMIVMGTSWEKQGRTIAEVVRTAAVPVLTTRLDEADGLSAMM